MQLWGLFDGDRLIASFLTELVNIGSRKFCNVATCGGTRMNEWIHFLGGLEDWARENGCDAMRFPECRKGWARVLKNYQTTRITLEKAL